MGEATDANALADALNRALALVARDAVALAAAAGTLPGPGGIALGERLRAMAAASLDDVERLAARVVALGGTPAIGHEQPNLSKGFDASVKRLLADGQATLEALVEAIPADADDVEGEATEHLLEHVIARRRDELEILERALR